MSKEIAASQASVSEPSIVPASTVANWWRGIAIPLLVALPLTLAVMTSPHLPVGADGDSSWGAVLDYAHQRGLQFGKDLTFTYGPLGFFFTPYFSVHHETARILMPAGLALFVSAGVCLVAWRLRLVWRVLVLGTFVFVSSNLEYGADGLVEIGLLSWGLICLMDHSRRLPFFLLSFTALAVICALAKLTYLYMAGLTVGLLACDLFIRKQHWLAVGLVAGFASGFVVGWLAVGQSLRHLPAFIANGFIIARSYEQTMALEAVPTWKWRGATTAFLALAVLAIRGMTFLEQGANLRLRRIVISVWMLFLLYMVWKHAFVLAEYFHMVLLFSFAPVFVLMLEAIPVSSAAAKWCARGLAAGSWALALLTLQTMSVRLARPNPVLQPLRNWQENFVRVFRPVQEFHLMETIQAANEREAQLPTIRSIVGDSTVDVFGSMQSYALANNLNYHPRPVFQSYAACNVRLMRLNEDFYESAARPEYVLFGLQPLLRRFPALEDALVLRDLLINYAPVANEGPFLLLKRNSSTMSKLSLLREGSIRTGQRLELAEFGSADLWLELQIKPAFLGHVREFCYQPSKLRLVAWSQDAKSRLTRLQAPSPMLGAGFLASPLLLSNEDVLNLYTGNNVVRPAAYSIETSPGEANCWQQTVQFRVYKIENRVGKRTPIDQAGQLNYPGFQISPPEVAAPFREVVATSGAD